MIPQALLHAKTMADDPMDATVAGGDTPKGFVLAFAAYFMWGFLPLYMKAVAHIPAAEVVANRVVWSLPVGGLILLMLGRVNDLRAALRSPRTILMATLTALLLSVNWGIYVWSIGTGRALDAALGYFINPLFSVFLGATVLKERLRPAQMVAIGLSAAAVVLLTVKAGHLPLAALGLTVSWGFYALLRKTVPVGPNQGFLLEVMILTPPAIIYLIWLQATGQSHLGAGVTTDNILLLSSGIITAIPLMVYANGARLLRLSTIGVMQYIAPTMIFLIAVFLFREPFDTTRLIAFMLIWSGLAIYSWSMLRNR